MMFNQVTNPDHLAAAVWGFVVGDALGVPVEFNSREELALQPVTDMMGWGTYYQPPGTWSDDSSMMLCTLEWLLEGTSMEMLADRFLRWYRDAYMTPHGEVFDIGNTTLAAIRQLMEGLSWEQSGVREERIACGNGSLMRVLPFAFFDAYTKLPGQSHRFHWLAKAGSITHDHPLPNTCCFFYVELLSCLCQGLDPSVALSITRQRTTDIIALHPAAGRNLYLQMQRILEADFNNLSASDIRSNGYVVHTLEAVLWCLFQGNGFRDTLLKAVNLGEDTDTVAALAGGLAGICYGPDTEWMGMIAGADRIQALLVSGLQAPGAGFQQTFW